MLKKSSSLKFRCSLHMYLKHVTMNIFVSNYKSSEQVKSFELKNQNFLAAIKINDTLEDRLNIVRVLCSGFFNNVTTSIDMQRFYASAPSS